MQHPNQPAEKIAQSTNGQTSSPYSSSSSRTNRRLIGIVALVLLLVVVGTLGALALARNTGKSSPAQINIASLTANAIGTVGFSDDSSGKGHNDVITVAVNGMLAAPAGYHYDAWLIDSSSSSFVGLGTLKLANGSYTLKYTQTGTNLLGVGNKVEVTLEQGKALHPAKQVLLSDTFPSGAFVYVRHLLVSYSSTPGQKGLLVGLFEQAHTLLNASQLLRTAQNADETRCIAQDILNILEGQHGADYRALSCNINSSATGNDFGLLGSNGYIALSQSQVSLAASQPDATASMRAHEKHVSIALQDMQNWLPTIQQDALSLLSNPAGSARIAEIVKLADYDFHGVDLNHDGSIDYVPGEAGATIAYVHCQYMVAMELTA